MRTLIQNGTIVNPDGMRRADLLVEGGRIASIADSIEDPGARRIDAEGCYVFPGFIDTHTHFDLDLGVTVTADDFDSGSRAAILGGTTTVLDFATQARGMSMQDALDLWKRKAAGASCHYGFHMAISEWNEARASEIPRMVEQGVTSFKMYMVYDRMRLNDGDLYDALTAMHGCGCIAGVHCENYDLLQARIRMLKAAGRLDPAAHALSRPAENEAEAVARLMRIAELAKAPAWVVHLSTQQGLIEARRARERGQEVYLETCPQYLLIDDRCYGEKDAEKYIFSPPARKTSDCAALLQAMQQNEIDVIGTDHCSFTMAQKAAGGGDFAKVPNGCAGVENRAQLIYTHAVRTGHIDPCQMAAQLSGNAAKLFGMPQKGALRAGADADIAVFDPAAAGVISWKTNAHRCDNSPYEGMQVEGRVRDVLLGGEWVVQDGALVQAGRGRYVSRSKSERPRKQ